VRETVEAVRSSRNVEIKSKPVGVEALAGGPASTTFNPYRLKPLLQHSK